MISRGLEMGVAAKPFFPVIWEERMEQNLEELRAELGIEAVKEGPWSWYQNPTITAALAAA
jgi:ubiquinone biosynthesis protein Coq4